MFNFRQHVFIFQFQVFVFAGFYFTMKAWKPLGVKLEVTSQAFSKQKKGPLEPECKLPYVHWQKLWCRCGRQCCYTWEKHILGDEQSSESESTSDI